MSRYEHTWDVMITRRCPYTRKLEVTEAEVRATSAEDALDLVMSRVYQEDGWEIEHRSVRRRGYKRFVA